ncbi:hypothetical protein PR003_g21324 [Phytophthora rubi]|uniref:Uncharacterized protein n=1 Tax=Phytophthora rubi TaxID=129364 RepID=A0A6A3J911_9STRA|nr:hypothetical protein PR002_g20777 [Phytophthora rubi]KAE8994311.1 hypothetical protein PR001_g20431 [Phytophthora rubi]KAE9306098.1 hypothetical protein PR003_g21324 [Phytophthora rubi]
MPPPPRGSAAAEAWPTSSWSCTLLYSATLLHSVMLLHLVTLLHSVTLLLAPRAATTPRLSSSPADVHAVLCVPVVFWGLQNDLM